MARLRNYFPKSHDKPPVDKRMPSATPMAA